MPLTIKTLVAFCLFGQLAAASWYDQKLEGWYYFQEREEEGEEKKPNSLDEAEEQLEREKSNLKKLLSFAILDPNAQNVENYIREQRRWVNQSSQFAEIWGKVLLEKPFLGDFLMNPTTSYGLIAKRDIELRERKNLLQDLSASYFLLFFFRGKDPLSEPGAEVAHLFASLNGWKVKSVSLDGYGTSHTPEFEIDKGLSEKLAVEASPSFFIINPFENKAFPVGAGLISVTDLEHNIEKQIIGEETHE